MVHAEVRGLPDRDGMKHRQAKSPCMENLSRGVCLPNHPILLTSRDHICYSFIPLVTMNTNGEIAIW
jgi:hypothetical protein